jgi:hypothetical protein
MTSKQTPKNNWLDWLHKHGASIVLGLIGLAKAWIDHESKR